MYAEELLKSALVDSGLIPINKFRDACSHSKQHDKSIDRSLIELEITSARQLGEALCQQFLLPYQPVCAHPASAPVWKALSPESALSWGVYPSEVNEEEKILTIIVPHPERASFVEKELLLSTAKHTPAFCIASSTEIEDALEIIKNEIGPVQHMPIKDGPPRAATSPSIRKIEIPAENRPYKVCTSLSDSSEEGPAGDDIKRIFRRPSPQPGDERQ